MFEIIYLKVHIVFVKNIQLKYISFFAWISHKVLDIFKQNDCNQQNVCRLKGKTRLESTVNKNTFMFLNEELSRSMI